MSGGKGEEDRPPGLFSRRFSILWLIPLLALAFAYHVGSEALLKHRIRQALEKNQVVLKHLGKPETITVGEPNAKTPEYRKVHVFGRVSWGDISVEVVDGEVHLRRLWVAAAARGISLSEEPAKKKSSASGG